MTVEEFSDIKSDLMQMLNSTIGSIVGFTKQSEASSAEQAALKGSLVKSKRVIELLASLNEAETEKVDEKLVEAILNLDHVNKEFKNYMAVLGAKQLTLDTTEINQLSSEITALNASLPKVLFASRCLPHPSSDGAMEPLEIVKSRDG